MTTPEMHTAFRTIGQQMGMQLIRSILPESIDTYINQAINEKVRNVVMVNAVTQFRDRVAIQDNSISPINSIRSLVRKVPVTITPIANSDDDFYTVDLDIQKVMFYTNFGVKYDNIKRRVGARFIESDKLNDTRDDYCNRESWDAPIVTMFFDATNEEYIELYIGNTAKVPTDLEVSYIELPAVVKHPIGSTPGVNCNLPIYLHNEIVELAVDKFFKSVGATTKPVARN